jgi:hypothetical protein
MERLYKEMIGLLLEPLHHCGPDISVEIETTNGFHLNNTNDLFFNNFMGILFING